MAEKELKKHLYVLILCGGGGIRLWPRSQKRLPKQFIKLLGAKSLFQLTVARLAGFVPWERIYVVTTTPEYGKIVREQTPKIPFKNILIEPFPRSTAMAHGLGAVYIFKKDPEAIILNESADHSVANTVAYLKNFLTSAQAAAQGEILVTTGVKPKFPHTGFGYVKKGRIWRKFAGQPVYKLEKFTEKPDLKIAQSYLKSGDYFWHANLFVWRANSYLRAAKKYAPKVGAALEKISQALGTKKEKKVIVEAYREAPEISVDYAIAEKARNFYLVIGDFGWEDMGTWQAVWRSAKKDEEGNALLKFGRKGEFIGIDTGNNLIHVNERLVAAIGIKDLIIVDTEKIILICSREKSEAVKKMVELLKEKGRKEYL